MPPVKVDATEQLRKYYGNLGSTPSSSKAEAQLNQFNQMAPRSSAIYNQVSQQLGVDPARQRVSNLRSQLVNTENLIDAVDDSVTGRTSNALVSEGQRQRLISAEREPLFEQYDTVSRNYGLADEDLTELQTRADTLAGLELNDIGQIRSNLQGRLTNAMSREEQARIQAAQARERAQMERLRNMLSGISSSISSFKTDIMNTSRNMWNNINASNRKLEQASNNSLKVLQPAAGSKQLGLSTYNPQRTSSRNLQSSGSAGKLLQGKNRLSGSGLKVVNNSRNRNLSVRPTRNRINSLSVRPTQSSRWKITY